MRERQALTPSQVGQYIKGAMDRDRVLSDILVRGEISNYKMYPSGHHYFSLKDSEGTIRCVMFRGDASKLRFRPENGMCVVAAGRVTVFPRDGQYQLYCTRLIPEGAGDLHVAFEQMKAQLLSEGLFDSDYKKPLPRYPRRIALVTSPAGAAVRDMVRVLGARFPLSEVYILPVHVQGATAAQEIADAIVWANHHSVADLIITGRGGGSMEDLWAFNEEVVARAVFGSTIPVISAVGHEPDVTITDFVADLRAATPSNAAELAVPDQNELFAWLDSVRQRMERGVSLPLQKARRDLNRLGASRVMENPMRYIEDKRMLLDYQSRRLEQGFTQTVGEERERFARLAASLDALSPLKVLGRGYSIARGAKGEVLASVAGVTEGDLLHLRLSDGSLNCRVEGVAPILATERK